MNPAEPRDRFFVVGAYALGDRVLFAPDDARKISLVLRMSDGARVTVIDSAGAAWIARLATVDGALGATLEAALDRGVRELLTRITIAQAIPKGQKMDLIVEKVTELGAAALIPLRSARVTGDHTGEHKRERWERIARSAALQSGRHAIPQVLPEFHWDALLATFPQYDRIYIPYELVEPTPLRETFERVVQGGVGSVLFIVGPEGGFAASEIAAAVAAGAQPISLGARILRTETVALVVLAAFTYALGEL